MLGRLLAPHEDKAYALLRTVAGLLFSFHGMQKLFGWLAERPQPEVGTQHWFGGIIELTCGLLICVGLFTRIAAFLASGTMAVAYVQFHWKLAFDTSIFPVVNGGELALLYAFLFLYIACRGPGRWSLDRPRVTGERRPERMASVSEAAAREEAARDRRVRGA